MSACCLTCHLQGRGGAPPPLKAGRRALHRQCQGAQGGTAAKRRRGHPPQSWRKGWVVWLWLGGCGCAGWCGCGWVAGAVPGCCGCGWVAVAGWLGLCLDSGLGSTYSGARSKSRPDLASEFCGLTLAPHVACRSWPWDFPSSCPRPAVHAGIHAQCRQGPRQGQGQGQVGLWLAPWCGVHTCRQRVCNRIGGRQYFSQKSQSQQRHRGVLCFPPTRNCWMLVRAAGSPPLARSTSRKLPVCV
jgi:hypothetical protein